MITANKNLCRAPLCRTSRGRGAQGEQWGALRTVLCPGLPRGTAGRWERWLKGPGGQASHGAREGALGAAGATRGPSRLSQLSPPRPLPRVMPIKSRERRQTRHPQAAGPCFSFRRSQRPRPPPLIPSHPLPSPPLRNAQ